MKLGRVRLAVALNLVLLIASAGGGEAQIPVTDVAALSQRIASYIQAAYGIYQRTMQIYNQYIQIQNQITGIRYQIQALQKLVPPNWRQIGPLLAQLDNLMRTEKSIAYSLQGADALFAQTFPGYATYRFGYPDQHALILQRTLDTFRGGIRTMSAQATQQTQSNSDLARIKGQMSGITGTQQALEMQNTMSAWSGEQLLLMNQTQLAQANMLAVGMGYMVNKPDQDDLWVKGVFRLTGDTMAPQINQPGFYHPPPSFVPDWLPQQ